MRMRIRQNEPITTMEGLGSLRKQRLPIHRSGGQLTRTFLYKLKGKNNLKHNP